MANKIWFMFVIVFLISTTMVAAQDYLFPGGFDGDWWGVSLGRNNDVPECFGGLGIGSPVTLVSETGDEYDATVSFGPVYFSPDYVNTWRIGVRADIPEEEIESKTFQLKVECNESFQCIQQDFRREEYKPEEDKQPGFAYGYYDGVLQRKDNTCSNNQETHYECNGSQVVLKTVSCDNGCSGSHCSPSFSCVDSDGNESDPSLVAGSVTVTRHDQLFDNDITVAAANDSCDTRALTEYYCDNPYASEISSVVTYCPTMCADGAACEATIQNEPDIESQPGCCLNRFTEVCTYFDQAVECCPSGEEAYPPSNDILAPKSQRECLSDFFFQYDDPDACAEMHPEDTPNWRICNKGCCCGYETSTNEMGQVHIKVTDVTQESSAECAVVEGSRAFFSYEEIGNCSVASCTKKLGGENRPPIFSGFEDTYELCVGDSLGFTTRGIDPDMDFLTYEANGLPDGASFQMASIPKYTSDGYSSGDYRFDWQPTEPGQFSVEFTVADNTHTTNKAVSIIVNECANECVPLEYPNNTGGCVGELLEFCLGEGNISAENMPPGASFEEGCFLWTPEEEGQYSVRFSKCDEPMEVTLTVDSCESMPEKSGMSDWLKGALIGALLSFVIAAITITLVSTGYLNLQWFGISLLTQPWLFGGIFVGLGIAIGALVWGLL